MSWKPTVKLSKYTPGNPNDALPETREAWMFAQATALTDTGVVARSTRGVARATGSAAARRDKESIATKRRGAAGWCNPKERLAERCRTGGS